MTQNFFKKITHLGILQRILSITDLDTVIRRDYRLLNEHLLRRKSSLYHSLGDLELDQTDTYIRLPSSGKLIRFYRDVSKIIYAINIVKYILLIAIQEKFISPELNCYLPGRISLHQEFIQYMPTLALQLAILRTLYKSILLKFKSCYQLDVVLFLLQDEVTLKREFEKINALNEDPEMSDMKQIFPSNILQTTLFYRVRDGNKVKYRLRPNRTFDERVKLSELLKNIMLAAILVCFILLLGLAMGTCITAILDVCYVKNYPTCCPVMEKMITQGQIGQWSIHFNLCSSRKYMYIFDSIDNVIFLFDNTIVLFFLGGITYIITEDLLSYWKTIDDTIRRQLLLHRYDLDLTHTMRNSSNNSPSSNRSDRSAEVIKNLLWIDSGLPGSSVIENPEATSDSQAKELQEVMEDFFECLARADKFVGLLVKLGMAYYITCNLVLFYFTISINDFWNLGIAKMVVFNVNSGFIASVIIATRIKTATDQTYTRLCSLVAHDKSLRKIQWIKVLENFTQLKRNNYTVARRVPFIWPYALNVMTTSLSFFIVVETFRRFDTAPIGV